MGVRRLDGACVHAALEMTSHKSLLPDPAPRSWTMRRLLGKASLPPQCPSPCDEGSAFVANEGGGTIHIGVGLGRGVRSIVRGVARIALAATPLSRRASA